MGDAHLATTHPSCQAGPARPPRKRWRQRCTPRARARVPTHHVSVLTLTSGASRATMGAWPERAARVTPVPAATDRAHDEGQGGATRTGFVHVCRCDESRDGRLAGKGRVAEAGRGGAGRGGAPLSSEGNEGLVHPAARQALTLARSPVPQAAFSSRALAVARLDGMAAPAPAPARLRLRCAHCSLVSVTRNLVCAAAVCLGWTVRGGAGSLLPGRWACDCSASSRRQWQIAGGDRRRLCVVLSAL